VHDVRDPETRALLAEIPDATYREVDLLQVRAKRIGAGAFEAIIRRWIERLRGLPPRVVVNDRLDVAIAARAHGVHIGQRDLPIEAVRKIAPPGFILGVSVHDRSELLEARGAGADYAGLGAFFETGTKSRARRLDPARAGLAERVPDLDLPVLAIGGITVERVEAALSVPAVTGIAVSSAVQDAGDPAAAIAKLRSKLDQSWTRRDGGEE